MRSELVALAVAAGACHSSHPPFPIAEDATPPDTLVQTTADAPPGSVTLVVTSHGMPVAGVPVYFQQADSSLVLGATTDAQGTAGAKLGMSAFVTAIEPPDGSGITHLATFAGVQPGDVLHLDLVPADLSPVTTTPFRLTVPTLANAASYSIYTSCGPTGVDASGTAMVSLANCGGAADMIVVALDSANNALGSIYAPGIPVNGSAQTVPGTSSSYTTLQATTFSYNDVPPTETSVSTYESLSSARGALFSSSACGPLNADGSCGPISGGSATVSLAIPATTGTTRFIASDFTPTPDQNGQPLVYAWGPSATTYTLDAGATLVEPYGQAPTFDAGTHAVTFTGGTGADLVRARIHAFRDIPPDGTSWTWEIVAPFSVGALAYPVLPASTFDWNPSASDTVGVDELTTAKVPGGYGAVRAQGLADPRSFVTGGSGQIVLQLLYSPPL